MSELRLSDTCATNSNVAPFLGRLSGDPTAYLTIGRPCPYETDPETWVDALLRKYVTSKRTGLVVPFAAHHHDLWQWAWSLERGAKCDPLVCIWPRGGGKSTTVEMVAVMLGALRKRHYVLYICETEQQAQDHMQNVAAMLENNPALERYYPHITDRMISKYGAAKGWNRTRIRCASGFTVDAIALNTAARGIKLDDTRPDCIILDDIDGEADSAATTQKKIRTLTKKLLPTGSADLVVAAVQNLIFPDSIFASLASTPAADQPGNSCECASCTAAKASITAAPADFLHGRKVSGPFPALHDFEYEWRDGRPVITGGRPLWEGQGIEECQHTINTEGVSAFIAESQQVVDVYEGGLFTDAEFRHVKPADVPPLLKVEVWVDPTVTETDKSDACGIQIDGVAEDGTLYRLWSWEQRSSPEKALLLAITKGQEFGATELGVETNQGGDLWELTYSTLINELKRGPVTHGGIVYQLDPQKPIPRFTAQKASASVKGKTEGASRMLASYQRGLVVHVLGTHQTLERALKRFPMPPDDLVDAAYWAWHSLAQGDGLPYGYLRNDPEMRALLVGDAEAIPPHDPVGEALSPLSTEERTDARKRAYYASLDAEGQL